MEATKPVFLIWGGEGWVAGHLKTLLESQGENWPLTLKRGRADRHYREGSAHNHHSHAEQRGCDR